MFDYSVFAIIVLTGFVFISNAYCEKQIEKESEIFHFRKARFGMSIDAVKKSEENKPEAVRKEDKLSPAALLYETNKKAHKVKITYEFTDDELFRCRSFYELVHNCDHNTDEIPADILEKLLIDYRKKKKALMEKHGKPYESYNEKDGYLSGIHRKTKWLTTMETEKNDNEKKVEISLDILVMRTIALWSNDITVEVALQYTDIELQKVYAEKDKDHLPAGTLW